MWKNLDIFHADLRGIYASGTYLNGQHIDGQELIINLEVILQQHLKTIYVKAIKGPDLNTEMAIDNVQLFINVKSCEKADCDNLEDSLSVTDLPQTPTTTITEAPVPQNKTLFENAFPAFMYQLQWTVGVPSGVIVFFIVLLLVVKAIDRQQLREKKRREAFSMQLLHEYKQSSGKQGGNPFFAITIPGPLYSDIEEDEEQNKPNGETPALESKTANGGGHIGDTKRSSFKNGQIVKCEINHHNVASSSTDLDNEPCSSKQLDDSDYMTLKQ
ncbi:hypothetical protein KUTeg_015866 [Tegillarca granosa]|uniref:Uncharacterized protein n=1 Tax=Tegillarca granosa TaxID=220873 RepID=A0ABQ9EN53_TEGGR|nr:hypothetical protein KUTeg_015866 [Tegillarca granosa]